MAPSIAIDIHVGCSEPAAPLSRRDALRSSVYGQARRLGFRTMPAHSRTLTEPSREIDVIHETDVLVVGSGPGGLAAALAASRAGVRVALVERNGCFGGNITQVGVEGFAWYRHEQTVDCEGIGIEFEERAKAMGAAMPEPQSLSHALDAEMFKWVADVLVQESGIQPLLHRLCVT